MLWKAGCSFWWAVAFFQVEKFFIMEGLRRKTGIFFVNSVNFFLSAYKQSMTMSHDQDMRKLAECLKIIELLC
jgi:hypothetical protein